MLSFDDIQEAYGILKPVVKHTPLEKSKDILREQIRRAHPPLYQLYNLKCINGLWCTYYLRILERMSTTE